MQRRIRPATAVALVTALALLTMVVSIIALLWNLRAKDLAHARGETISLSHILAEQTTRSLQNVDLVLQNVIGAVGEVVAQGEPLTRYSVHSMLRDRLSGMPQIKGIFILDTSGRVLSTARTFPAEGIVVADREYFQVHRDNRERGLYIGTPTHNRVDGQWTVYLSRRLNGRNGEFAGVVAVALKLKYFEELYQSITFDGIEPITLYLADGTLVASAPHSEAEIGKSTAKADEQWFNNYDESTREEGEGDGARIVTYHQVEQFPLVMSVAIGKETALESWHDKARFLMLGSLGVALLVVTAAVMLVRQLARQERLAQELLESARRLKETVNAAMDAIIVADAGQRVVLFNQAAESMFGYRVADAVGMHLEEFVPPRHREKHRHHVENFGTHAGGARLMMAADIAGVRADGTEFPIEATISRVSLSGETLYAVILRDITERRRANEQLLVSNRQLRQLSARLQNVREDERRRIARELHDELGQQLTGLKMELSWLGNQLAEKRDNLAAKVDSMKQQIDTTVKSVRRISTDLRPALLDDLGLCPAIEWLATDFSAKTGIDVDVDLSEEDCAQTDALATALFRIAQECLTNVARHAEANRVAISLHRTGDALELTITDDGKGMDEAAAAKSGGYGLIGIRERAIMLGARTIFTSSPGAGTTVAVVIPFEQQDTTELEP